MRKGICSYIQKVYETMLQQGVLFNSEGTLRYITIDCNACQLYSFV